MASACRCCIRQAGRRGALAGVALEMLSEPADTAANGVPQGQGQAAAHAP
jgi:hypothetical protein